MQVSEHFRLEEFACHDGTPVPAYAVDDVKRLCRRYLEPIRARWGPVVIISGYRTAAYNRQVDGAPDSMHIYRRLRPGAAADFVAATGTPRDWHAQLDELDQRPRPVPIARPRRHPELARALVKRLILRLVAAVLRGLGGG